MDQELINSQPNLIKRSSILGKLACYHANYRSFLTGCCKSQNGVLMGRSVSLPACLPAGNDADCSTAFKRLWRQPWFLIPLLCNSLAEALARLELAEIIQRLCFSPWLEGGGNRRQWGAELWYCTGASQDEAGWSPTLAHVATSPVQVMMAISWPLLDTGTPASFLAWFIT